MIGEETCHPAVRAMLAYARALARSAAPLAAPRAPAGAGERLFVLERDQGAGLNVRAWSEGLVTIFGADLRRAGLSGLLSPSDRALLHSLLACCAGANAPGVVRAHALTAGGRRLGLEMILSPLSRDLAGPDRFLGYVEPLAGAPANTGGTDPIAQLMIGALLTPFAPPPRRLTLVVNHPG